MCVILNDSLFQVFTNLPCIDVFYFLLWYMPYVQKGHAIVGGAHLRKFITAPFSESDLNQLVQDLR